MMDKQTIEQAAESYVGKQDYNNPHFSSDRIYTMKEESKEDFIAGAEFAANQWIPVENGFPEVRVDVLFCNNTILDWEDKPVDTMVNYGWYDRGSFHTYLDPRDNFIATHWMPIPEPPES